MPEKCRFWPGGPTKSLVHVVRGPLYAHATGRERRLASRGDVNWRYNAAEDPNCWLTNEPESVFDTNSMEEAEFAAYSYLGRNPDDTAYISDDEGRMLRTYRCDAADELRERLSHRIGYFFAASVLCFTALLFAAIFGRPTVALVVFAGVLLLFSALTLLRIQNHFESLLVTLIVEVLVLFATWGSISG